MRYTSQKLIEEYFKEVKEKNPEITLEELKKIVSSPFEMVKEDMQDLGLSTCRLQYLGTFFVSPYYVPYAEKRLDESFKNSLISEKYYQKVKQRILKFYNEKEAHNSNNSERKD